MRKQCGFAAVSAIFLIVVIGALGSVMLTISNTQHLTSAQDVMGTRAYWAAQGGLEWGIASVAASSAVFPAATSAAVCPTGDPPKRLNGFTLKISCNVQAYAEADVFVNIFQLTSIAQTPDSAPGSQGYIERSVSITIER